uniref:Retrotransposon protein, putative, Ty1-copia subclass n=1 Tax=Tanacetum cinerariifolium TaxID=118510 RepID=A0A699IE87_TANCI|nr:hypothetical protein [Tanacetum cinerariifolium]
MYCSMVSAIVFATSFSEYSWSENKLKSCDLILSRLSVLQCLLDDRNSCSGSSKGTTFDIFQNIHILYLQYGVLVFSGYDVLIIFPSWSLEKPQAELKVSCYADASFQTNKDDTKSQMIYVFVLNGGAVDWKSAKQSTTAINVVPSNKRPIEMLCDNEPAIAIANDLRILKEARNFQRKYHYIHEVIQEREIVLKKVHTYYNVDDPFTKPLPFNKHYEHGMAIGIVLASSLM